MAGTNKKLNSIFYEPVILLKNPQLPENIGMVARTMVNFGLKNLRIIKPLISWPNKKSIAASAGAFDIIKKNTQVYENLEDAIQDIEILIATTVRKRDLEKRIISPNAAVRLINKNYNNKKIAFLFGAEKAGLKNEDLYNANILVRIPTNNYFGSLNLAMAVNIICYEWFIKKNTFITNRKKNLNIAKKGDLNHFIQELFLDLKEGGFFSDIKDEEKLHINFKNMIAKNLISNKELKMLYGIKRNLKKSKINN